MSEIVLDKDSSIRCEMRPKDQQTISVYLWYSSYGDQDEGRYDIAISDLKALIATAEAQGTQK